MSIYVKIKGIRGNVTTKSYEGAIELKTLNLGAQRVVTMKTGSSSNRQIGLPNLQEIEIEKELDSSSSDLWARFLNGTSIPKVEIDFCDTSDLSAPPYLSYELENVMISSFINMAEHSNLKSWEIIRLSYTNLWTSFWPRDAANKVGTPKRVGYSLETSSIL